MFKGEVPVFRHPDGLRHNCPECGGPATIQHWRCPVYGHFCPAKGVALYWTQIPGLVFLSLSALTELVETGEENDAA